MTSGALSVFCTSTTSAIASVIAAGICRHQAGNDEPHSFRRSLAESLKDGSRISLQWKVERKPTADEDGVFSYNESASASANTLSLYHRQQISRGAQIRLHYRD